MQPKSQDVLVMHWIGNDYTAYLTHGDSSFQLRYDGYEKDWSWSCKSRYDSPISLRWQPLPFDTAQGLLFTAPPCNGYQVLLLTSFIGYTLREDRVKPSFKAKMPKDILGYYHFRRSFPRGFGALEAKAERIAAATLNRRVLVEGYAYRSPVGGLAAIKFPH